MRRAVIAALLAVLALVPRGRGTDRTWSMWDAEILDGRAPRIQWTEPQVDSIGRSLSAANRRAVIEIDSLFRSGAFGPSESEEARADAHRAFKRCALGPFDYIARLAADSVVREADARELRRPFGETFVNMGAFPFDAMSRVRVGRGGFRIDYDLREGFETTAEMMVGVASSIRTERDHLEGADRLLLRMAYPSGRNGALELLFDTRYSGLVEQRVVVDRGDTLDLTLMRDIEGLYVRKWGIHRVGGLAAWRGRAPGRARLGAAAYFPNIELRLPWFLPDLGFDDLRDFHVPRPIWERRYVREDDAHPDWLGLDPTGAMLDWESEGPRPRVLDEIYPDR